MLSRVWTFPEMFVDVYVSKYLYFCDIYICTINGFLLPKFQHSWYLKKTDTKGLTVRHCNFFHVQIHCPCQWIMTLPPKILWPTALLNTWNIITFPKSSFYHTNHTFLTNINVWMMDFWSINTRIKKNSSAQNTILCREWLLQKLTFRHSEITIFNHSQYPTQRTFGEPPAPSVYIYIYISIYTCCHFCQSCMILDPQQTSNHGFGLQLSWESAWNGESSGRAEHDSSFFGTHAVPVLILWDAMDTFGLVA